jgi:metallophosphoesterase (TIGR03768 family)
MKQSYEFQKFCLVFLAGMLIFTSSGCGSSGSGAPLSYPIDSNVQTTRQSTIAFDPMTSVTPPINLSDIPNYSQYGYGVWTPGSGIDDGKRTDIMATGYTFPAVNNPTKLLNFFSMSDIHISDKESPVQFIYLQQILYPFITSGYSPVMLSTTHVLDAAIQTVNALHKLNSFDFGISLGDATNSGQYNEARWYIDVFDGKVITPSSGVHAGAETIDYQKPYKAAGLDKTIPWYQTIGNHDHFLIGTNTITDYLRPFYTGENVLTLGNILTDSKAFTAAASPMYYVGVIDGSTPYGSIKYSGLAGSFSSPPKITADPDRRSLLKKEWMNEFFTTTSSPVGHGFTQANLDNNFACYSFQPKQVIPIRVIVLDDTQRDDDANIMGYGHGELDKERYDWLVNQMDNGQAEGQLMIIAAHIPIAVDYTDTDFLTTHDPTKLSYVGWSNTISYVTQTALIAKLQTYPNILMWIAGHRHLNTVKAFISPDPAHPEYGFWQVETSSLRDFPQEFRTFQINLNSDYTISIITTDVDPAVKAGSPAAISRYYAVAAEQMAKNNISQSATKQAMSPDDPTIRPMPTGSYNAELVKQLSPAMKAKMQTLYP